jgi:hypothetical protein
VKIGKLSGATLAKLPPDIAQFQFIGGWVNGTGLEGVKDYVVASKVEV